MRQPSLPGLVVLLASCAWASTRGDSGRMAAGASVAIRGGSSVRIEVTGVLDRRVRGFSLAMGHDASRVDLVRVEAGPLFADAELISQNISNEADDRGPSHGEIFVILDFQSPFDHEPVDLSRGGELCSFVYDVKPDAEEGAASLHLGNREYGRVHREVSSIFVDTANQEVYPELVDGRIDIVTSPVIVSASPGRGSLEGGTRVSLLGAGLAGPPAGRVFFGVAEASITDAVGDRELLVLSPPATARGTATLRFEGPLGAAVLPDAFEYAANAFLRGDCNQNDKVDITDPIFALRYLFLGEASPPCKDACDVDDDGQVRIADSIRSLDYLFRGGDPPQAPFPSEGLDPTGDALPCDL